MQKQNINNLIKIKANILKICELSAEFIAQEKAMNQAKKWLHDAVRDNNIEDVVEANSFIHSCMGDAVEYALDLAIFTPSLSTRKTAIDRLMQSGRLTNAEDKEAAELLRGSKPRFLRSIRQIDKNILEMQDLATDEILQIFADTSYIIDTKSDVWLARTCVYQGQHIAITLRLPADDAILKIAKPYFSKNGVNNPLRCLEAVYKYYISFGSIGDFIDRAEQEAEAGLFVEKGAELYKIADKWASFDKLPEPSKEELAIIRREVHDDAILIILNISWYLQEDGEHKRAEAYFRVLFILMETLHRRQSIGLHEKYLSLDGIVGYLQKGVNSDDIPIGALQKFIEICEKVRINASASRENFSSRGELDKALQRIQALRGKTVERGCTEEEALGAAEKIAEMLEKYGLSLGEIDLKEQRCSGEAISTTRSNLNALDTCTNAIANFCDCRHWVERTIENKLRHIFFGLPADVLGAHAIYEKIEEAFESETEKFKKTDIYRQYDQGGRRQSTISFQEGMIDGVIKKLNALKKKRNEVFQQNYGRSLVPIKSALINNEIEELGLELTMTGKNSPRSIIKEAYKKGEIAGESIMLEEKLNSAEA